MGEPTEDRRASLDSLAAEIRVCTRCRLSEGRTFAVPGEGPPHAAVFLIGEAPGRDEDAAGRPFVGAAGKVLGAALGAAGLVREDLFVTNVVKCRPPKNRTPRDDELGACHPFLAAQIEAVRPRVLVTLGATGLRSLLGPGADLKSVRSKELRFAGIPLIPTYHPAAVLYNRRLEVELRKDLRKAARLLRPSKPRVRSAPPRPGVPFETAVSSGGVVVDPEGRVLLLRRADEDIWCLPKGTVEPGEDLESTAVREIAEETGLRVKLLRPLLTIHYRYYWPPRGVNVDKTVAYFLAEPVGGRLALEEGFDEARWSRRPEALRRLHWKNDRDVVLKAFEVLGSGGPKGR
jgi:DNA polymerase